MSVKIAYGKLPSPAALMGSAVLFNSSFSSSFADFGACEPSDVVSALAAVVAAPVVSAPAGAPAYIKKVDTHNFMIM